MRSGRFFDRRIRPRLYYTPEVIQSELLTENIWNEVPELPSSNIEATLFNDLACNTENSVVWFPADSHGWALDQRDELRAHDVRAETSGTWYDINNEKKKFETAIYENADEVPIH